MNPERPTKKQSTEHMPSYGANGNDFGFIMNDIHLLRPLGRNSFLIKKNHTDSLLNLKFFLVWIMLLFFCFLLVVYLFLSSMLMILLIIKRIRSYTYN